MLALLTDSICFSTLQTHTELQKRNSFFLSWFFWIWFCSENVLMQLSTIAIILDDSQHSHFHARMGDDIRRVKYAKENNADGVCGAKGGNFLLTFIDVRTFNVRWLIQLFTKCNMFHLKITRFSFYWFILFSYTKKKMTKKTTTQVNNTYRVLHLFI